MKLYYSRGACSLSVRIIINELGLTADYIAVDLKTKKTNQGDDYLLINPKGAVPALITDENNILTENTAIHQYLADTNKAYQLLPPIGDFNRYRVLEFLSYASSDVHKSFGALFNPNITTELKNNLFIPLLKNKLNYLDKHLQQHAFLVGNDFTLPDAYLFVMILWLKNFQIDLTAWPNLSKYFTELKMRKSIQKSLEEEGINL